MKRVALADILWFLCAVPKCAACGRLLAFEEACAHYVGSDCLCPECRAVWEAEKLKSCPDCGRAAVDCVCMPPALREAGVEALVRVGVYTPEARESCLRRVILRAKRQPMVRLSRFAAAQLASGIRRFCDENGVPPEQLWIVPLPRSRRKLREYGHDQSVLLARVLARRLGAEFAPLLRRTRESAEQKTLGVASRWENVRGSMTTVAHTDVTGRCVVLIDDVVTSGASMAYAAALMRHAGASRLFGAALGLTRRKKWHGRCRPLERSAFSS